MVLVFVDRNGNGILDPGERPLAGVGFLVDGVLHSVRTDATGSAFLMHLPSHREVDLALKTNDLEDPGFSPVRKGLRFTPRVGLPLQAAFSVIIFDEATGTVRLGNSEELKALSGVSLKRVDGQERMVQR